MKTLSITEAKEDFAAIVAAGETVTITRRGKPFARLTFKPLDTTDYLTSTPANRARLAAARDEIEAEIRRRSARKA